MGAAMVMLIVVTKVGFGVARPLIGWPTFARSVLV